MSDAIEMEAEIEREEREEKGEREEKSKANGSEGNNPISFEFSLSLSPTHTL